MIGWWLETRFPTSAIQTLSPTIPVVSDNARLQPGFRTGTNCFELPLRFRVFCHSLALQIEKGTDYSDHQSATVTAAIPFSVFRVHMTASDLPLSWSGY